LEQSGKVRYGAKNKIIREAILRAVSIHYLTGRHCWPVLPLRREIMFLRLNLREQAIIGFYEKMR
jgi:hypothetical protein